MPLPARTIQSKDGRKFILREIRETDAADLNALVLAIISTSPFTLSTPAELDLSNVSQTQRIRRFIHEPGYLILVIEEEGNLIGTLDFKNNEKKRSRHWGEFGMGLKQEYRGLGLGRHLLQGLIDWAKNNPIIEKICLGVYPDNIKAQGLYHDMGFIEEGRNVKAIKKSDGHYFDEIRMYLFV